MANNINKIVDSLNSINQVIENFRLQREKTELYDSNRFNPFRFMYTNEIGLSKILAFLLDPTETHGQGDLFLNSFLKYIGKNNFLAYDSIQVSVEKKTNKNRRHDIFIEGFLNNKPRWIISIENKLRFASDQIEQLKDYRADLERKNIDEYCLIYLPVFRNNPTETSISKDEWDNLISDKKAIVLSADDLVNWLDNTLIISPVINQFCQYFKKFLSEELMGNKEINSDLVNHLMQKGNNSALYSALSVINLKDQLYESLVNELIEQLESRCDSYQKLKDYGWKCNTSGKGILYNEFGIFFAPEGVSLGVGVEFSSANFGNGYYGVYCNKDKSPELNSFLNQIFSELELKESFEKHNSWIKWKYLDGSLLNWNADILRKIPTGDLADTLFELWEPLLDVISKNIDAISSLEK